MKADIGIIIIINILKKNWRMRNLETTAFITKERKVISGWLLNWCIYLDVINQIPSKTTNIRTVHKLKRMGGGFFTSPIL